MSNSRTHSDNITMSGGGLYSLATIGAKHVIDQSTPLVTDAIRSMDLSGDKSFAMTDMGCADGGTSLEMVRAAINTVRDMNSTMPVNVIYADQPGNDYNALLNIVYGKTQFDSWMGDHGDVFPFASATGFYDQVVPAGSLDLGFSATAMHWLSEKPTDISDHVQAVGASGTERTAFERQASADWQRILLHRARELKPGGALVLMNFGVDEDGRYLGNTGGINMFDTFNSIWQQFVDDGVITAAEYRAMTLPQYYNTVEEFRAPFDDASSAVAKAGLELTSIHTGVVRCPFAMDFESHGDSARFAREYIPTIRSWNESIFKGGLSSDRSEEERSELIENYYGTYESMVRDAPEGHGMDYVHSYIVARKRT